MHGCHLRRQHVGLAKGNPHDCPDLCMVPMTLQLFQCQMPLAKSTRNQSSWMQLSSHVLLAHQHATNNSCHFECTLHCETGFIKLLPCKAALPANVRGEIKATDLATTVQGAALFHLLHLCLGFAGVDAHQPFCMFSCEAAPLLMR